PVKASSIEKDAGSSATFCPLARRRLSSASVAMSVTSCVSRLLHIGLPIDGVQGRDGTHCLGSCGPHVVQRRPHVLHIARVGLDLPVKFVMDDAELGLQGPEAMLKPVALIKVLLGAGGQLLRNVGHQPAMGGLWNPQLAQLEEGSGVDLVR